MKRFIFCLLVLAISINSVFADELRLDKEAKYQKQIMQIGYRVLNANQIDKRMTFFYVNSKDVNAATTLRSKQISVYKGLLPLLDSDDELAAVICHEIAHGLDAHKGLWRRFTMAGSSKSYEFKADKKGVDLMVNAGYNPIAMIVILNKITAEPSWFERYPSHPGGSERLLTIYSYIYSKYPEYLVDNDYKNNLYYQNFLLTTKKQRAGIRERYKDKNIIPVSDKK